jgi:hypothetical protein
MTHRESQTWMTQWKAAGPELDRIRTLELQALSQTDALAAFERVAPTSGFALRPTSGLVTQQALLHRTQT